jgi:hypothetical protein
MVVDPDAIVSSNFALATDLLHPPEIMPFLPRLSLFTAIYVSVS